QGRQLARFSQTVSVVFGSRHIFLDLELSDFQFAFTTDPWKSYAACRFAWSDENASLRRSVHLCSVPTTTQRIEAPDFIAITTAILTGGLPYHCRSGPRMLDCLLKTSDQSPHRFQLAIALDAPSAPRAALEFLAPTVVAYQPAGAPISPATGWLFHLDSPNL